MLIIKRKVDESFDIGNDVKVTILGDGHNVKIGIDAPKEISILRSEIKGGSEYKNDKELNDYTINYSIDDEVMESMTVSAKSIEEANRMAFKEWLKNAKKKALYFAERL